MAHIKIEIIEPTGARKKERVKVEIAGELGQLAIAIDRGMDNPSFRAAILAGTQLHFQRIVQSQVNDSNPFHYKKYLKALTCGPDLDFFIQQALEELNAKEVLHG